jgi:RHS repeat-associated protein
VTELDAAGRLAWHFIYASKRNVPDVAIRASDGGRYRVISDQLGSPVLVVNAANGSDVLLRASYSAFGAQTVLQGSADALPFGFAGGLYDAETALVRFGARDYELVTGRWTQKDPIRFMGGSANLFVYVRNAPVNQTDPTGLRDYCDAEVQALLDEAVSEYGNENVAAALLSALENNSAAFGIGKYDFLENDAHDHFSLPGLGHLDAGQFGNYFAGYVNYGALGSFGSWATSVGGPLCF